MAPRLRLWLGAALAACVLIAAGYLPPRGGVRPRGLVFNMPRPLTAARLRAQAVGAELRAATAHLRVTEARAQLGSEIGRRAQDARGVVLLILGPDSLARRVRPTVAAALDTVWHHLGLGETKVAIVFVLDLAANPGSERTYVLPDSTDRTTCAVWQSGGWWVRPGHNLPASANFGAWLQNAVGPCAFYAAFGSPGRPVRQWLGVRNFDLTLYPGWAPTDRPSATERSRFGPRSWWWDAIWRSPPATLACLGGRAPACRAAVLRGAVTSDDSVSRIVTTEGRWWLGQSLIPGERYLADVAAAVGPERFLRFWNSPLPVDTTLTLALGEPIGDWTTRWERRFSPPLPLGPAAPLGATALSLLVAAFAVWLAAMAASRRQVR
jgi:hypothetical protein